MVKPQHGKETFHWCDQCGSLILGRECSVCGSALRAFRLSLPADVRPCMGDSIRLLKGIFQRYFGTGDFLDGRLIFFNRIAGEDRTDEVVVEGSVVGILRFDVQANDFRLDLNEDGARILAPLASRGIVTIREASGHLKGRNLGGSEVLEVRGDFEIGDPVLVFSGNLVCAGVARASSRDLRSARRALGIRGVGKGSKVLPNRDLDWEDFWKCNQSHLKSLESKAISDIRSFLGNRRAEEVTVSFSGGKDSLASLRLAVKAVGKVTLLFANTGLEFPETVDYVRRFASDSGLELLEGVPPTTFWDQLPSFGPPAKDFRWCCKVCKLSPITTMIEDHFPDGVVTIEGNRVYESFSRAGIGFVVRNPFVPGQINLNPIREWRSAEVWGYIWMEGLEYNPLYDRDFQRIGCYLCPACLESEWKATREIHPELYGTWESSLKKWASDLGADPDYIEYGFWRWKNIPPKMRLLADRIDLTLPKVRSDRLELRMVKGASPCASGGYSVEGVLTLPIKRDFSRVAETLKVLGKVRYSDEYQIALVRRGGSSLKVFGGGQVTAIAPSQEEAEELFEQGVKSLLRAQMCSECSICVKSCPTGAISLSGGPSIDDSKCNRCGKCVHSCVVAHYFDKLVTGTPGYV